MSFHILVILYNSLVSWLQIVPKKSEILNPILKFGGILLISFTVLFFLFDGILFWSILILIALVLAFVLFSNYLNSGSEDLFMLIITISGLFFLLSIFVL